MDPAMRRHSRLTGQPAPATVVVDDSALVTVLAAEADPDAYGALTDVGELHPFRLVLCADGAQALFLAGKVSPDLILLSAQLSVVSSQDVVVALRIHLDVPLYLGIRAGEADCAGPGLAAGATGVVNRPYEQRELDRLLGTQLARAKARLQQEAVIHLGQLVLDSPAFEVRSAGRPIELTLREFELLRFLMLNAGRAVTQDQIRVEVWGARNEDVSVNTIAVHVGRLRVRLAGTVEIVSIRGVGYRLTAPDSDGS
jgi:two-component system KDP operon response regulator KdpE